MNGIDVFFYPMGWGLRLNAHNTLKRRCRVVAELVGHGVRACGMLAVLGKHASEFLVPPFWRVGGRGPGRLAKQHQRLEATVKAIDDDLLWGRITE